MIDTLGKSVKELNQYIDSLVALGAEGDPEPIKNYVEEYKHVLDDRRSLGYIGVSKGRVQIAWGIMDFDLHWELRKVIELMLHFNGEQEYLDYVSECMIRIGLIKEELEELWY